jgi:hypothetical protein
VPDSLSIPRRFNGPPDNGNGGYSAGVVASSLQGPAEVSLRSPVPLDTALDVIRDGDGSVRVLEGDSLIAEARPVPDFDLEVPAPVSSDQARDAAAGYRGLSGGTYSRCFVCGLDREDALGVFAGNVEGRDLVASPWTPPAWTADGEGQVLPEFLWAVLDCPSYFALYREGDLPLSALARLAARIEGPVAADEELVVIAWPLEFDGRKHHAGAAVVTPEGEPLAVARALWVAPRGA